LLEALLRSPDGAVRLRAALALAARERRTGPSKAILDRAHSLPDEGPAELRVRWGLMVVRTACGALKPDLAEEVLPRIEPLVDDGTRAEFLIAQSFLRLVRRDPTASASLARQAIVLDPAPRHHLRLGVALFELGEQAEAVEAFQRARQDTDPFRRGHATYGLCTAMMEQHVAAADTLQLVQQAETEGVHAYPWLSCRFHFLRGALQSELGELDEAQREYLQAAEMHRVLGEAPSQLFMELNAYSLGFAARRVPEELLTLTPDEPTPYGRAMLGVWRAVTHAVLGHHHAAEAVGLPALEQLGQISPREAHRMACLLAVALAPARPALATSLLPVEDDALLELARAAVDGQLVQPSDWIEERILAGIASLTRPRVVVARDGSAFIGEDGERVDIARRRVLRRILEALAAAEAPLDVDAICACVWPGERLVGQSGTRRVHVAISTLRGLGLRSAIETDVTGDVTTWRLEAELVDAL
jgi:tetratricopeptide (TPR) repeat protein